MGEKTATAKKRGLVTSKPENAETGMIRRLRRLEEKIDLLERGLDINITEANAVLLFVQHHAELQRGEMKKMMVERFTKQELNLALVKLELEPDDNHRMGRIALRILKNIHPDKFRHKRSDTGTQPRQGRVR